MPFGVARRAAAGRPGFRFRARKASSPPRRGTSRRRRAIFGVRLQPATLKPSRASASAASLPITPRPMTPTATSLAAGWSCTRQMPLALLRVVEPLPPMMHQHMQHDVFGHPHGQVGMRDARQRHLRQGRIGQQMIDAGAEIDDRLEIGKPRQQAVRRQPDAGIGDVAWCRRSRPARRAARGPWRCARNAACHSPACGPSTATRMALIAGRHAISASGARLSASHCSPITAAP